METTPGWAAARGAPGVEALFALWSRRRDSNPEPAVYKTAALPIELRRRDAQGHTAVRPRVRRGMIRSGARKGQAWGVRDRPCPDVPSDDGPPGSRSSPSERASP